MYIQATWSHFPTSAVVFVLSCAPLWPLCPSKTSKHTHTLLHMVLITTRDKRRDWAGRGNSKRKKYRGSLLPVSFTTEPWLFSQESVPPVAQQPGNNGMRDRDRWGWSYPPFLFLPLSHSASFWLLRFKRESKGTFKISPRLKDHFFPPPLVEQGAEGCVRAQMGSILIVERSLLWETEGEEGPLGVRLYKTWT